MPRFLRFTLIGCGGLIGLFVIFAIIGALVGGNRSDTAGQSNPKSQSSRKDHKGAEEHTSGSDAKLAATEAELKNTKDELKASQDKVETMQKVVDDANATIRKLRDQLDQAKAVKPVVKPQPAQQPAAAPTQQQVAAPASDGKKHVMVKVTADVPTDVLIADNNLDDPSISEQITGTKTWEFDTDDDSGLLASAMSDSFSAHVSVTVYENGKQIATDTDSTGMAQVSF